MIVLKFGGTSCGSPDAIHLVCNVITKLVNGKQGLPAVVVLSAFTGVTDSLLSLAKLAAIGDLKFLELLQQLEKRHLDATINLNERATNSKTSQESQLSKVRELFSELKQLTQGVFLLREASARTLDLIASFGERLCATIVSGLLAKLLDDIKVEYLDARSVIKTDSNYGSAAVDFATTNTLIKEYFESRKMIGKYIQVVTGFIGSTFAGETTTLGRGGSDYTASIFGASLNASEIQIWTDVDGVLTADPRRVEKPLLIHSMSYEEAMEMSYFGAKVIYPPTMGPAMDRGIPLRIKNTFNADAEGTLVCSSPERSDFKVRGISSISDVSLLNVKGCGMVGVAGISHRLFGSLALQSISVVLITQASSEHSISFAVNPEVAQRAREVVEREFELEIMKHQIDGVSEEGNLSIVAVVGEGMKHTPNLCGKMFDALGKNHINIKAVAQGSSELNISVVVSRDDLDKALGVLHDRFFRPNYNIIHLFVVGLGLIGSTLLQQIQEQSQELLKERSLEIRVVGLANTKHMLINLSGIALDSWKESLSRGKQSNFSHFVQDMINTQAGNRVFIDCTSSAETIRSYPEILQNGIHIVTPNKKANSSNMQDYQRLQQLCKQNASRFLYETNVGAGLPVISTLKSLLLTGDKLVKIEAILSGTLSYIFNSLTVDTSFSEIVNQAKAKGYTEPDPRDDLNGMDVARKILILAREAGIQLELHDVNVESLVPPSCRDIPSVDDFMVALREHDIAFSTRVRMAFESGKVLRYIASLEHGKAKVSLQEVDQHHAAYNMSGSDNIIIFTTQRYLTNPLVIKGPGAGPQVTAAGVFFDALSIFV